MNSTHTSVLWIQLFPYVSVSSGGRALTLRLADVVGVCGGGGELIISMNLMIRETRIHTQAGLCFSAWFFFSHSCHPAIPFANSWSIIGPFSFSSLFKFCFFHCLTAKYVSFCEFCDPHHHMYPYRNHHSPLLANPSTSRHKVQSRSSISLTNQWDLWELSALSALSLVGQWLTYVWHLWFGYPC